MVIVPILLIVMFTIPAGASSTEYLNYTENFVDTISNLHAPTDIGTHSAFAEMQDKDASYDTLTEADTDGATQVAYVSSGTGSATITTSCTPAYPGTLTAGNLLLGEVMILDTATAPSSFNGFTSLLGPYTSGTDARVWIYYKYSTGSESGTTTVSRASGTTGFFARIHNFRYVHATIGSAYEAVNWVSEGSVSTILDQSVTTTGTKELAINFVYNGEDTNTYVSFTGETGGDWTEVVAQFSNGAGNDGTLQLQCATMAAAGTINGGSYNAVAADPTGVLGLALKPATTVNYDLDLEVGWTSAEYEQTVEYLCLYGGTQGAEALRVDIWAGSWITLIADVQTGWNNISISTYLTSSAVEIRFTDTSDDSTLADTWQIEAVIIKTYSYLYTEEFGETIELYDSAQVSLIASNLFNEVLSFSESVINTATLGLILFEQMIFSETVITAVSFIITFFEVIGLAASSALSKFVSISLFEIISINATMITACSFSNLFYEILPIFATVSFPTAGGFYELIVYEILTISSSVATQLNATVILNEVITFITTETMQGGIVTLIFYEIIALSQLTPYVNIFYELFLSLELWGYFGPLALVIIGYFLTKKERGLGIFFIIVDSLIIATYLGLVEATPQYWWHIFILILGVIQCTFRLVSR